MAGCEALPTSAKSLFRSAINPLVRGADRGYFGRSLPLGVTGNTSDSGSPLSTLPFPELPQESTAYPQELLVLVPAFPRIQRLNVGQIWGIGVASVARDKW